MSDPRQRDSLIVPLFVPNQGCPRRCVYCSQGLVTGREERPLTGAEVAAALRRALGSPRFRTDGNAEVAFYGGTFTGLPMEKMRELLEAAHAFIGDGAFSSIRVSTRPDALDSRRLELMRSFGVRTVELGVQSMDDEVLEHSRRGYRAEDVCLAAGLLKQGGFRVGVQLMPGLPGETEERFQETIKSVKALRPDLARLYPTVVFRGTRLSAWYRKGRYRPLTLQEAVDRCAFACAALEAGGIPVVRIGLLVSGTEDPTRDMVAGPWHPALGFLVRSRIFGDRVSSLLPRSGEASKVDVLVHPSDAPLARGYRNQGLAELRRRAGIERLEIIPDPGRERGQPAVETTPGSGS